MKAVDANLLDLLKKATQFVVPIYQRVYSWDAAECEQLWKDILRAGASHVLGAHFTGSIVYVEKAQGNIAQAEPALIIEWQQRITTLTLLLAALAAHLDAQPEGEREPVESFSPRKIRGLWLTNEYEDGEKYFKLLLSQSDRDALKAIVRNTPIPVGNTSRVVTNYQFFSARLSDPATDVASVCRGISKAGGGRCSSRPWRGQSSTRLRSDERHRQEAVAGGPDPQLRAHGSRTRAADATV